MLVLGSVTIKKPRHPLRSHGLSLACPGLTAFLTRAVPRAEGGTRRRVGDGGRCGGALGFQP